LTGDGSATRPRSSPRWRSASPCGRSTRPTPNSDGTRSSWRTSSTRSWDRTKIVAALDRLEAELGSNEYLVGDSFGVADLTAASLFYPLVIPDEGPLPSDEPRPAGMESFSAPLKERPGYQWVEEIYRGHRRPNTVAAATATHG
jgi:glutathione S-transferase